MMLPFTSEEILQKTTLNAKLNNWGVDLSDYNIKFKLIKGTKNMLAYVLMNASLSVW